jgi:hypothetical protein
MPKGNLYIYDDKYVQFCWVLSRMEVLVCEPCALSGEPVALLK